MEQNLHSLEELKQDLMTLGIRSGDTIVLHSSYKSLGGIERGAEGFFSAFMELLGKEGTLVVPALSFEYVNAKQPEFDREKTPSCIGYLPEYFRTQVPGVIRSLHPTHSCCVWGRYAKELTMEHELDDTPVGKHSPFYKVPKLDGKILMLGCSCNHNTSMHGVEETAEPPYLFNREKRIEYVLHDGDRIVHQSGLRHYFGENGVRCYKQRYSRILSLLSPEEAVQGKVLSADSWLLSAKAVWEKGHQKLLEEPFFFVERACPKE